MENKKNNSGILVGILIGIIVMLLVFVGLVVTNTISFSSKSNEKASGNTNESIKVDTSKDYVYDANYNYDNKYTEFDRSYDSKDRTIDYYGIPIFISGIEYLKNLVVPYININSADAKIANNELESLYLKYAKDFDNCADETKNNSGPGCSQVLTYRTYKYKDILSIVVIDDLQATSPYVFNYHIYNFDLNSGDSISYEVMLSKLGYDKETVINNMKKNVKEMMSTSTKNVPENDLSKACHYSNDNNGNPLYNTSDCYEITYQLLQESINNNTLLYMTDNDGFLNILPIFYYDFVQNGDRNHYLVKVSK